MIIKITRTKPTTLFFSPFDLNTFIVSFLFDFYIPATKTNGRHGAIDSRKNITTFQSKRNGELEALDFHKLKSRVVLSAS